MKNAVTGVNESELRLLLHTSHAGGLIGKGGSRITQLREVLNIVIIFNKKNKQKIRYFFRKLKQISKSFRIIVHKVQNVCVQYLVHQIWLQML